MSPSKPFRPTQIPLRERQSLAEQWESFALLAIPNGASENQVKTMRDCYYAGALTVFSLTMENLDPDKEPTEGDIQYMESIFQEIRTYAEGLGK
jgi:hypothetical protein